MVPSSSSALVRSRLTAAGTLVWLGSSSPQAGCCSIHRLSPPSDPRVPTSQRQAYDKALTAYQRLLELDREFVVAYFDLANCYRTLNELKAALRYQQRGVELLDNLQVATQAKNQAAWYFTLGEQHLSLDTLERKQCYAYRSLAATLQALHQPQEAERYRQRPCGLDSDEQTIEAWVEAESQQ
jgi:tetratricopeptide (TPR) repeat protein